MFSLWEIIYYSSCKKFCPLFYLFFFLYVFHSLFSRHHFYLTLFDIFSISKLFKHWFVSLFFLLAALLILRKPLWRSCTISSICFFKSKIVFLRSCSYYLTTSIRRSSRGTLLLHFELWIKVKINLVRSLMFLDLNVNAKLPPTVGWIIRIYKRYRYLIFFANDQFAIWSKFTAPKDLYYSLCTIDTLASNRPLYVMNVIFVSFVMLALNNRLYWWICTKSYFFECMVWSPTAYHFLYRYLLDFKY